MLQDSRKFVRQAKTVSITLHLVDTHHQENCDRPYNEIGGGVVITVDLCPKLFRYGDTHPCENTISMAQYQVDTHSQEICNRPCTENVVAVITVYPCQKMVRYADTHPSENTILITLH